MADAANRVQSIPVVKKPNAWKRAWSGAGFFGLEVGSWRLQEANESEVRGIWEPMLEQAAKNLVSYSGRRQGERIFLLSDPSPKAERKVARSRENEASARKLAAAAYEGLGRHEKAALELEGALRQLEEIGNVEGIGAGYNQVGWLKMAEAKSSCLKGDWRMAEGSFDAAMRAFEEAVRKSDGQEKAGFGALKWIALRDMADTYAEIAKRVPPESLAHWLSEEADARESLGEWDAVARLRGREFELRLTDATELRKRGYCSEKAELETRLAIYTLGKLASALKNAGQNEEGNAKFRQQARMLGEEAGRTENKLAASLRRVDFEGAENACGELVRLLEGQKTAYENAGDAAEAEKMKGPIEIAKESLKLINDEYMASIRGGSARRSAEDFAHLAAVMEKLEQPEAASTLLFNARVALASNCWLSPEIARKMDELQPQVELQRKGERFMADAAGWLEKGAPETAYRAYFYAADCLSKAGCGERARLARTRAENAKRMAEDAGKFPAPDDGRSKRADPAQ